MPTNLGDLTVLPVARYEYTFRFIDATGDLRSTSFRTDTAVTIANLEALKVAIAAATNASLYEVQQHIIHAVDADAGDAIAAPKESVSQNVVYLAKNPVGDSRNLFIPAPVAGHFLATTDELDPTSTEIVNVLAAWVNVLPAGYSVYSGRFSGRREKNKAVKI